MIEFLKNAVVGVIIMGLILVLVEVFRFIIFSLVPAGPVIAVIVLFVLMFYGVGRIVCKR